MREDRSGQSSKSPSNLIPVHTNIIPANSQLRTGIDDSIPAMSPPFKDLYIHNIHLWQNLWMHRSENGSAKIHSITDIFFYPEVQIMRGDRESPFRLGSKLGRRGVISWCAWGSNVYWRHRMTLCRKEGRQYIWMEVDIQPKFCRLLGDLNDCKDRNIENWSREMQCRWKNVQSIHLWVFIHVSRFMRVLRWREKG